MPESYTERGFANYAEFTDRYGNEVAVRQSSLASEACVWIFCHAGEAWLRASAGSAEAPSPHLTVEMAARVRDALDEFIRDHTAEGDDGGR